MKRLLSLLCSLALLSAPPLSAQLPQARVDSLRAELVRSRGFVRAAETQLTKTIAVLDREEAAAVPTVMDWRTGEWRLNVGGYRVSLDLDSGIATAAGVSAPATVEITGDTLRARLAVPGYESGLLELVHAEGRLIGTVTADTIIRPAAGQRPHLAVVRTVDADPCVFALYSDGSWGVAPYVAACHQALDRYAGGMRFVARTYTP